MRAELRQDGERRVEGFADGRVRDDIALVETAHHADAQPAYADVQVARIVANGDSCGRRIVRIAPSDRLQCERCILDRPGQRADVVE